VNRGCPHNENAFKGREGAEVETIESPGSLGLVGGETTVKERAMTIVFKKGCFLSVRVF